MNPNSSEGDVEEKGKTREELLEKIKELSKRIEELKNEQEKCYAGLESSRYLAAIVESSDDAIIGKTLDGIITSWNKGAERTYGYRAEEVIGKSISILVPADRPDELPRILETLRQGKRIEHYETLRVRKDGKSINVSLTISPIKDASGKIIGASTISRDITERKIAEEALGESREKFRRIVETAEEGVLVLDKNNNVVFANQRMTNMLGYSMEEILARKIFAFADKESEGCLKSIIAKHHKGIKMQFDFKFRKKDGSYMWAIVPTTPFFNELGDYTGALYMISDITDHIKIEEELHAAKAEVEVYLDLLSHDIRNLNQASMGYLELALEALERGIKPDENLKQLLYKSLESLNNSSLLIDNVKMLMRKRAGEIKLKAIDICHLLADVKKQYEIVPGREVTINYMSVTGCLVMANELLKDVFSNIVGNAIKHSTEPLVIDMGVEKVLSDDKRYYRVNITDNGPGIPDELKAKIFTRFERGKAKVAGNGLGLYLVKTLLDDFHGVIWIEDRIPGDYTKGSRFVVMLPAI